MTPDDLDLRMEDVAVIFAITVQLIGKMQDAEIEDRPSTAAVPRDILNCSEAMFLASTAMVLAAKLHPQLMDPETLMHAIRGARGPVPTVN